MQQIKKLQALIEDASKKCVTEMKECESERDANLTQIGNVLHPSVPISNNEVRQAYVYMSKYMYVCINSHNFISGQNSVKARESSLI